MPSASDFNPTVLLVAEHASAVFGGEALIPFQYFKHLRALGVDAHLLVHQRTQRELTDAFPNELHRIHFVPDTAFNIWCNRIGKLLPDRVAVFTTGALSHLETQLRQRRKAKSLSSEFGFNIIHETIPVSPKLPSALFGMPAPVIIGPMNGGMDYPAGYEADKRVEKLLIACLRATAVFWNIVLPGKRQASLLLVANQRTRRALPANLVNSPVVELVENGVDVELFKPAAKSERPGIIKIIHIGRLVDFKRVDLLLKACALLIGQIEFEVDLVGDGPLRASLERQIDQLGLGPRVKLHGRLPHQAAAELLRQSDVMVLTSMRECGGAVVLEAMATGLPVVAADWGGPADYLNRETGILIPPSTPAAFVQKLGESLVWLSINPEARAKMGEAARREALERFDWHQKARALVNLYRDVTAANAHGLVRLSG